MKPALLLLTLLLTSFHLAGPASSHPTGQPLPDGTYGVVPVIGSDPVNGVPAPFQVEAFTMLGVQYLSHPEFGVMLWNRPSYEDLHGNTFTPDNGLEDYVPKDPDGEIPENIEGGYTESHADGSGHSGYLLR